ncbi:hypothetical protein HDV01_003668 [Terramyces sp. JEL0728]|nr:hypothetical protein HDV01_003668 [Terramyces sp. JEL0728]
MSAQSRALRVIKAVQAASSQCPCHGSGGHHHHMSSHNGVKDTDYAFELATSNIRYGLGVTKEVGMDMANLKAKKVVVFTDPNIAKLGPLKAVVESLEASKVPYIVYDGVKIEPTDISINHAVSFVKKEKPDAFIAVGGGSVIDTAKAANLYLSHPDSDFLDFVNAPIGKGIPPFKPVFPLVAVPTTAGTGSETTGTSIFDYTPKKFKTGIAFRSLKPLLGLVDPYNTRTMPPQVHVSTGLDVLCHSLESYTAIPYNERSPRPKNPILRPAYQGSNPISDIWSMKSLKMCIDNLPRAYKNPDDHEAQEQMILAATFAGIGFGNAGVHLCHGMSYPISGLNKKYNHPGYASSVPLVPHGISVALSSPAVFEFTAPTDPDRHLEAAKMFGVDVSNVKREDAGKVLSEALRKFLQTLDVPDGLEAIGFNKSQLNDLVLGTLPQHRVTKLAPTPVGAEELERLFEKSWRIY